MELVADDDICGDWEELKEGEVVVHMDVLIDDTTVTLAVYDVLELTEGEPEDDMVIIRVRETVALVVIDCDVDWVLVTETVEHGLLENDTETVTVEEDDTLALTDIRPVDVKVGEFVPETVAQEVVDWESDWVFVKEIVVHVLAE